MQERIHDMASHDRPREKMALYGAEALSNEELLAIFIRTGTPGRSALQVAKELLKTHGGLSQLGRAHTKQLAKTSGVGLAKATQIAAAFELGVRAVKEQAFTHPMNKPERVYDLLAPEMIHLKQESVRVVILDAKLCMTQTEEISKGSVAEAIANVRDVLHPVVLQQGYGFILAHNHPSGDCSPSQADISFTNRLADAANLFGIRFHDHIIIGRPNNGQDAFYSFREHGLL